MKDYTTAETFVLPSGGKIYPCEVNPNVTLRSMTTADEMRRLSNTEAPYKLMCDMIDDCMTEDIGISSYDMCLGDYQFLLHKLRIVTYGKDYKINTVCPYCGCSADNTINLDDLKVLYYTDEIKKYLEFDLPVSKKHITIRMQTPRLLDDINLKTKEARKKSSNIGDPAFLFTLESIIATVDGYSLDTIKLEEFIKNLPMADSNIIIQYAQKLNESIGLDTGFVVACDVCGFEYRSSFRFTPEFFRPTINL